MSSYQKNKTQSNLRSRYANTNVSFDVIDQNNFRSYLVNSPELIVHDKYLLNVYIFCHISGVILYFGEDFIYCCN